MPEMTIYDLRVTVEQIEGRSVCGLQVGDFIEVTEWEYSNVGPAE